MISERVLQARMAEVGRIKIGGLDETIRKNNDGKQWQMPKKFDHFVITTMDRDQKGNFEKDAALHSIIGDSPRELKIRLLYNDIELNFRTELAYYQGKTCVCRGDGEKAQRLDKGTGELIEVACPCDKLQLEKYPCKPHGVLHCLLENASMCGGVHKFATTSWNTIRSILSSLKFIQTCTGGKLAGLPLTLKYFKKATQTKTGQATTIPVVTIIYEGNPVQMLEMAIDTERKRLQAGIQLETLEAQVRREMNSIQLIAGPLDEDEIPEFHPENVEDAEIDGQPTIGDVIKAAKNEDTLETNDSVATSSGSAPTANDSAPTEKTTATKKSAKTNKKTEPPANAKPADTNQKPEPKTETKVTRYKCSDCGRESDNPGSCKCAQGKTEPKTANTPKTPEPPKATPQSNTPPGRGEMTKQITRLRAVKRILTPDWQKIVNDCGIKDLNASTWSDDDMAKILQALEAK